MRYGVLADVHGNLDALRAVLRALERHGVDGHLFVGDLVGYGPYPNECIAEMASLGAICVAGNHDLIALGQMSDNRCIELARNSLRWTREVLGADERAFLEALPRRASVPGGIVLAHGALDDPQEYTSTEPQALAQLAEVEDRDGAHILVLGHTHRPMAYARRAGWLRPDGACTLPASDAVLLNPGAAGQSRELRARARFAVLDLDARRADFFAIPYDIGACRSALRRVGLSPASCHVRPSVPRAAARAARAAMRRRRAARGERERSA
jgi:predicted phosphodiesterase